MGSRSGCVLRPFPATVPTSVPAKRTALSTGPSGVERTGSGHDRKGHGGGPDRTAVGAGKTWGDSSRTIQALPGRDRSWSARCLSRRRRAAVFPAVHCLASSTGPHGGVCSAVLHERGRRGEGRPGGCTGTRRAGPGWRRATVWGRHEHPGGGAPALGEGVDTRRSRGRPDRRTPGAAVRAFGLLRGLVLFRDLVAHLFHVQLSGLGDQAFECL